MKRISFFLTLVFTAALGSLYVASAQDADEPATPAAPEPATKAPVEAPQAPTRFPLSPGPVPSGSDAMHQEP